MRYTESLKNGFRFKKFAAGEVDGAVFSRDFDDSDWREIAIPHDWGIEGDFSADNDLSYSSVWQDGILSKIGHTGRTGGLPTVGEGVYRKWVRLDEFETAFLECDGIMWESRVYINGTLAGGCHFGYLSFEVDITALAVPGDNLIAIHAIVPPASGRWYSGAGLYRNLRLVTKPKAHIAYNGVWVRQAYANAQSALVDISVDSVGTSGFTARITDPRGDTVELTTEDNLLSYLIEAPMLWDVDAPNLYTATVTVPGGDSVTVRFGVRSCEFTKDGFFLNGRYLKMRGVCAHHDMGMLGAAVNRAAMLRQIEILKGMGVNAIRTTHNPPAPELLELCDEHGILTIVEFFDEWQIQKVDNGYHNHFDEHAIPDLESIVRRDRNHPSVIMWSLGNEVLEQREKDGWKITRMLHDATKRADPTRPTTAGLSTYPDCFNNRLAFYMDVVGLNYKPHTYKDVRKKYPHLLLVGSETASCISTRGVYTLPAEIVIGMPKNEELTVSDYSLAAPPWAYYAERELAAQVDSPDVMGEFIWTGFDYLGEPTPYYTEWPSRSSYFGAIDLAGLPKNRYYGYRAAWSDAPTLHIFPHWNWEGMEGKNVPIHIYTNYDEVELFINGISQGKRRHATGGEGNEAQVERFRLIWKDTVYTPGEVLAVAYKDGKEAARATLRTAGAPHRILLSAYSDRIGTDGEAVNFITASIVDKDGNLCPKAADRLTFKAEGGVSVFATDAGDQRETETFLRPDKRALSGMLVACVKATGKAGTATVTCEAEGLEAGTVSFLCED